MEEVSHPQQDTEGAPPRGAHHRHGADGFGQNDLHKRVLAGPGDAGTSVGKHAVGQLRDKERPAGEDDAAAVRRAAARRPPRQVRLLGGPVREAARLLHDVPRPAVDKGRHGGRRARRLRPRHIARRHRQPPVHDGHDGGVEAHGPLLEAGRDSGGREELRDAQELPRDARHTPEEGEGVGGPDDELDIRRREGLAGGRQRADRPGPAARLGARPEVPAGREEPVQR